MNIADLRKALDKFRDILLDNDACDHILSEYDGFHDLFSAFQKDYEKLLKELAESNLLCGCLRRKNEAWKNNDMLP